MTPPWNPCNSAYFSAKHAFSGFYAWLVTNVFIWQGCYFLPVKFSVFVYGILWNLSMASDSLSTQHVVAYAFSVKLATLKMMTCLTKVTRIWLCTSHSIICLIPKRAELHGLHGDVIICVIDPWVYVILWQIFKCNYSS